MKKLALPLLLALAVTVPAAAAGGKTYLGGCSSLDHAKYKPHMVVLACGDASLYVNHLKWSSWGKKRARGHGRAHSNTCKPSCAQGKFRRYPAKLKAYRRVSCTRGPKHQFSRVRLTFTGKRPSGAPKTVIFERSCSR